MIKNFETYINEDYFSKLANRKDNGNIRKENEITEELVRSYVQRGQDDRIKSIKIRYDNGNPIVDITGTFFFSTDEEVVPFKFGEVSDSFFVTNCPNIKTLDFCPDKIGFRFQCMRCPKITSLRGFPKEVNSEIYITDCDGLISLVGAPEKTNSAFCVYRCKNLKTLEGLPKEINGNAILYTLGETFSKEYILKLSNVKGNIVNS